MKTRMSSSRRTPPAHDRAVRAELHARGFRTDVDGAEALARLMHARLHDQRRYAEGARHSLSYVDRFLVAADAWEEAARPKEAARLRLEALWNAGEPTPPGVSVPHGIYTPRMTMRGLRARYEAERAASDQGEGVWFVNALPSERYAGPYVGPGGVFFVAHTNYSPEGQARLQTVRAKDWRILPWGAVGRRVQLTRLARELASGERR